MNETCYLEYLVSILHNFKNLFSLPDLMTISSVLGILPGSHWPLQKEIFGISLAVWIRAQWKAIAEPHVASFVQLGLGVEACTCVTSTHIPTHTPHGISGLKSEWHWFMLLVCISAYKAPGLSSVQCINRNCHTDQAGDAHGLFVRTFRTLQKISV